ncbi:MAG: hypothetical protein WBH44_06335 [Proteocatella sp.]
MKCSSKDELILNEQINTWKKKISKLSEHKNFSKIEIPEEHYEAFKNVHFAQSFHNIQPQVWGFVDKYLADINFMLKHAI